MIDGDMKINGLLLRDMQTASGFVFKKNTVSTRGN